MDAVRVQASEDEDLHVQAINNLQADLDDMLMKHENGKREHARLASKHQDLADRTKKALKLKSEASEHCRGFEIKCEEQPDESCNKIMMPVTKCDAC